MDQDIGSFYLSCRLLEDLISDVIQCPSWV